jgi:hypothetical protein
MFTAGFVVLLQISKQQVYCAWGYCTRISLAYDVITSESCLSEIV